MTVVIISAQDLDTHSFDNTELKEKFGKAVVQMRALVNMLCDWRKGMDDGYLKRIKNQKKKKKSLRFYQLVSENADESNKFVANWVSPLLTNKDPILGRDV